MLRLLRTPNSKWTMFHSKINCVMCSDKWKISFFVQRSDTIQRVAHVNDAKGYFVAAKEFHGSPLHYRSNALLNIDGTMAKTRNKRTLFTTRERDHSSFFLHFLVTTLPSRRCSCRKSRRNYRNSTYVCTPFWTGCFLQENWSHSDTTSCVACGGGRRCQSSEPGNITGRCIKHDFVLGSKLSGRQPITSRQVI